jgi:hypothetical protein
VLPGPARSSRVHPFRPSRRHFLPVELGDSDSDLLVAKVSSGDDEVDAPRESIDETALDDAQ